MYLTLSRFKNAGYETPGYETVIIIIINIINQTFTMRLLLSKVRT